MHFTSVSELIFLPFSIWLVQILRVALLVRSTSPLYTCLLLVPPGTCPVGLRHESGTRQQRHRPSRARFLAIQAMPYFSGSQRSACQRRVLYARVLGGCPWLHAWLHLLSAPLRFWHFEKNLSQKS